jgi:beta-lactamase regulating signal transducer with metallopeptidase domain
MESFVHTLLSNALAATVLAVVATCLARACRRPAVTHSLWLLVMVKLITPPLVPIALPDAGIAMPARSDVAIANDVRDFGTEAQVDVLSTFRDTHDSEPPHADTGPAEDLAMLAKTEKSPAEASGELPSKKPLAKVPSQAAVATSGWKWEPLILVVIFSGAVGWWTLAMVRIIQFQRVLSELQPVPGEWQSHTDDMAKRMGLSQCPRLCLVPGRVPPMLWAIGGKPQLLVPSQLWRSMEEDGRTSLVLHELAHLKRRDHWVRWLELAVAGLYWWHPVAWWARRELREAEEQCCDAWVVWAMPQGARTYAAALLTALEFVSGARTAPAVASATSGNGHVSCLKRRFRMIMRAKTPKSLSWAGRIAVLGMAALLLPLAPSWAENKTITPIEPGEVSAVGESKLSSDSQPDARVGRRADETVDARIARELENDRDLANIAHEIDQTREQIEHVKRVTRQPNDPSRQAAENHLRKLTKLQNDLRTAKRDELLARRSKDDDKDEKTRDAVERFQDQLTDLIGKIGKELGPVTEEVRKALERAVGEVHKSLDKEGFSAEDLGKALEKSQEELRKAFESGGPVNDELRGAIDRSRKEMQDAVEQARGLIQDQVEALRQNSAELADRAQENLDRAKREAESAARSPGGQERVERSELENARREIRELEQQLRRATRRLEELERRGSRRPPSGRRDVSPRTPSSPREEPAPAEPASPAEPAPRAEPAPDQAPKPPVPPVPPARPAPFNARRPQPGNRPVPRGMRGAQSESDKRLQDLEEKMNRLLKELDNLKDEKSPK